ncbi:DUF397 domain-containing protein [Streptomyces sp. TRM 70361]|uniref:DUF397 domain-containing protein n=1 Tax=Streptomyces sp. TRM 70361 TaxID=3116553 RepID=UPI002E7BC3F9|nr:DUF397 domain-containing protein [Streptomyces sp. TRM 70361]MEE1940617.1 DUF397 domain-containing protein [Streptomyces sp. TRM 70361]
MTDFEFHKSTHSGGQPDSQCVEVATNVPGTVAIRDSKALTGAPIRVAPNAWDAFLTNIRQGT